MNTQELRNKIAELTNGQYLSMNSIIREPGKFEGEPVYTLYYYDEMLNGDGSVMEVSQDEKDTFDLQPHDNWVYVHEDSQGFVSLEFYETETEAEEAEYADSELYNDDWS